ncbi:hypothetical protein ACF0H5_014997 [Mactra antiquata]
MSSSSDRYFNGTCEEFDLYTCKEGVLNDRFLDPCSCGRTYRCTQTYELIPEDCPEDTLWDMELNRCNHAHAVKISQQCEPGNSWLRCNTTVQRTQQLQHICTNLPETTVPPATTGSAVDTTTMDEAPPGETSAVNIGLIVGLIAVVLVVVVLIILIALYLRKRNVSRIQKKRGTATHNPEYFENGNQDDPYAIIDDRLTSPAHISNTITQTNGGFTNNTFDTTDDPTPYDNSVERPQELGYTGTLNRSFREYETAANASSGQTTNENMLNDVNRSSGVVNDDESILQSKRLDENGNRNSKNSKHTIDSDSTCDSVSETNSNQEMDNETAHDYFVLNTPERV